MSYVGDLKNQIKDLEIQIRRVQQQCSHPQECVKKEDKSNTGNYDPACDSYWTEFECLLCEKLWRAEQ